jgi:hypothetical protein
VNLLYVTIICYTLISPPTKKKKTCGFTIASSFPTCFDPFARSGLIGPSTSRIAHHRDPRKMSPSRGNVRGNHPERGKSDKNWSHAIPRFLDIPKTISILCLGSRFLDELVSTLIGAWSWLAIILHLLLECYNVTHAVRVSGESWWKSLSVLVTTLAWQATNLPSAAWRREKTEAPNVSWASGTPTPLETWSSSWIGSHGFGLSTRRYAGSYKAKKTLASAVLKA